MGNDVYSWDECNVYVAPDKFSCSDKEFQSFNGGLEGKESCFHGAEDWGDSDYDIYGDESMAATGFGFSKQGLQQQQQQNFGVVDGLCFNAESPLIPMCFDEIMELNEEGKQQSLCLSSLGLPNNYSDGFKRLHGTRRTNDDITVSDEEGNFSTEEIMRIAGEMFIKSCSMIDHPSNVCFSGMSDQERRDVELAMLLLAAVEKLGCQQYESASRLLTQCDYMSSKSGNPVQRVVYYFTEALREKMERSSSKGLKWRPLVNIDMAMMSMKPIVLACHQEFPFAKATQFAGIQAIVEHVAEAKKVHIIDLAIRHGIHWTILMQALASCGLELLKITAVSTEEKDLIENTGKRLSSFAQTMGIPFAFKVVMVSDMLHLKEDLFEIDAEESIVIYAAFTFRRMLVMPNRIENIMKVLRVINPCLMVVTEIEANHNSPIFVNRFIEVLFFFSAYFDCTATCMKEDIRNRETVESVFFGEGIRNMIASEGDERKVRHVKIDVWRAFFGRYMMEEVELSMSSMYQVDLILKTFACGASCTHTMDGKTLLIGWKGTPIHSISVWKFL